MDWASAFSKLHSLRPSRAVTFKRATGMSGTSVVYAADRSLKASVRYREVGFDAERGVLYPESRVEVLIWLRDWFDRTTDGATAAELSEMVTALKGDVKEGSPEHFSRFVVDGATYKYDRHALDERPDGTLFAVIVTLQAA